MSLDNRITRRRRARLVEELEDHGAIRSAPVARVMRTVPRHVFVPEADEYRDEVVVTKSDSSGRPLSSCSQPAMVAIQLEQLRVRPGHRVLEIGAGTGYNAALLSELVGPEGAVYTVDLDDDIVERARRGLSAVGHAGVTVGRGDGERGWVNGAPFDRIIATVGVGDVPAAWWEQLRPGGRVALPLAFRGMQRAMGMVERDGRLIGDSMEPCGFIPVRGIGAFTESVEVLNAITVAYRDADQSPAGDLADVLAGPSSEWWLDEPLRPFDRVNALDLMLAVGEPGYRRVVDRRDEHAAFGAVSGVVDSGSFARLVYRRTERGVYLGVRCHGRGRDALVERLRHVLSTWSRRHRQVDFTPTAVLTRKPLKPPASVVVDKPHTLLAFVDARH